MATDLTGDADSIRYGRLTELVPLGMSSLDALYEIVLGGGAGISWRTRGRTVSRERIASILWEAGDCAFAVKDRARGSTVGFVGLFGHDLVSSVASISAFFDQRLEGRAAIAGDALEIFCRYVFEVLGVRKLTAEVPSPLAAGMRDAARRLPFIEVEGCLKAHSRFGRNLEDVDVFAVWADPFLEWDRGRSNIDVDVDRAIVDVVRLTLRAVLDLEVPDPLDGGYRLVEDLGLDSLGVIELVDRLEAATGRTLLDQVLGDLGTVQDLLTAFEGAAAASAADLALRFPAPR